MEAPPGSMGWEISGGFRSPYSPAPGAQAGLSYSEFWECFCCSAPWEAWALVNGRANGSPAIWSFLAS